jgi:hypothetical protein
MDALSGGEPESFDLRAFWEAQVLPGRRSWFKARGKPLGAGERKVG